MLNTNYCVLLWSLIALFATAALTHPAEDKSTSTSTTTTTTSTTTEKPVRHPNYVKLLNRKKNQNETEDGKKNGTDPALAALASGKNLTLSEIKNIVPYLDFTTEATRTNRVTETTRPRGLAGLLNIFRAPLNAFRNFGNRNRTSSSSGPSILTRSERITNSTSTKNTSSPAQSNSIFSGPGRLLAGFMKVMQNMTVTFEQMIDSFTKLFNFGGSNSSRSNRSFF